MNQRQFLYSGVPDRLGRARRSDMTVIGLAREHGRLRRSTSRTSGGIWPRAQPVSRWRQLASRFPAAALRSWGTGTRTALIKHRGRSAGIRFVLDSINGRLGAAPCPRLPAPPAADPRILYLAQNDETEAALAIARAEHGVKRMGGWPMHARRAGSERWLVAQRPTWPAPTRPTIAGPSNRYRPDKSCRSCRGLCRVDQREPRNRRSVPRRAIVVGSFDWAAKRAASRPSWSRPRVLFAGTRSRCSIVGRTEDAYAAWLRQTGVRRRCGGTVSDPAPYLADARIALVPDVLGGFKIKTIDYEFSRTPIFAIEAPCPGCRGAGPRPQDCAAAIARGARRRRGDR
jgi:hypothetical protein